jgi:hypothetical protein
MPDKKNLSLRRLVLFLFEDIFSILFYVIFPNFKVLDIILQIISQGLLVKGKYPNVLEEVSYI